MHFNIRLQRQGDGTWSGWIAEDLALKVSGPTQGIVLRKVKAEVLQSLARRIEAGDLEQESVFQFYQSVVGNRHAL